MFYSFPTSLNDPVGRAMAQAVSHCALIPCGDVVDKVALGQFLLRHFGFHLPLSFHQSSINFHSSPPDAIYPHREVAAVSNTITPSPYNVKYKTRLVNFVIMCYCQKN
jgi:hypothetical protein